jgi:hypothetical protein
MECVTLKPWIWAAFTAIVLSTLWGFFVQGILTSNNERDWRGLLLGPSEGIIFTVTFAGFAIVGSAWLGFKVASKWKSWSLIADARKAAGDPVPDKEFDTQYHRFLIGTAGNVVIGLVAAAVGFALGGRAFS